MTLHELMVAIDSMPEDVLPGDARAVALVGFDTTASLEEQKPEEHAIVEVVAPIGTDPIALATDPAADATAVSLADLKAKLDPIVTVTPERLVVIKDDEEYAAIVTVAANRAAAAFAIVPAFEGYELLFDAPPSGC